MVALREMPHSARMLKMLEDELMSNAEAYAPQRQTQNAASTEPYLKQDFDGKTLYVSSVMTTPDEVDQLIRVLTAFKGLIPGSIPDPKRFDHDSYHRMSP